MYATDFIFDGVNLSSKGYMICSFDGDSIVAGGEIEPIVKKTPATDEYTYYAAEINNVLTWELGICKLPCGTEAFEPLNQYEESELAKFLLKTDGYRWIQFVQPDDYPDIFYKVYINMTPYQIGGQTFGFNLTITSNCGYGFSHEYTATLTDDNQPLTINVNNDLNRYIYPTVSFETNADECWIYNENDLEQNLDNGRECHFYNLGDNVDVLKEINMDSGNDLVQGLENPNQFNFRYLRLVNGENNIYADGILADDHYSTTEWNEVTQYNYHPVKNWIPTGDISHIKSSNGIRTKRIAVDYELSGNGETTISGSSNIVDTITVPNDNYTTLKTKLKNLIFEMEDSYNYVYLYKMNDYEYKLFGCNYPLFYVPIIGVEGEFHSGSYYEQQSFDIYTVTIDNITGEISDTSMLTSTYSLEEDGASFLYVPIEIKDYYGEPYIPITRIFTPTVAHIRNVKPLFKLDGLPEIYKTGYPSDKRVVVLRKNDTYYLWESTSDYYYGGASFQGSFALKLTITPGSGIRIYTYDTTNETWSLTYDGGGIYSEYMGINGCIIGDVVFIAPNTHVKPWENTGAETTAYPVVGGETFSYGNAYWHILHGGTFIEGGNDEQLSSFSYSGIASNATIDTGSHGTIKHNEIVKWLQGDSSKDFSGDNGAYVYNPLGRSIRLIQSKPHQPSSVIVIPTYSMVYLDSFYYSIEDDGDSPYAIIYKRMSPETLIEVSSWSYNEINIPLENGILSTSGATYNETPLYNINRTYTDTCDISAVMGNVLEYSYDKYDPIESQQNAIIKYREIRRVLV